MIDDYNDLSIVPLEVKSGKDYTVYSALNNFINTDSYGVKKAYVLSNERVIHGNGRIIYVPIYNITFM